MPLITGQSLSFYEILGPLGAGAMGEVYRARDTRLDREVAIKVLPEHFAEDRERIGRFEREAKSLASLNHPNVAQIFGVDQVEETYFIVLELVPGETLEHRIARGALPLVEAVEICRQIAGGLEAAHEAGVIHRDLKPANVRITPNGEVKVLDFGLAKAGGPDAAGGDRSDSVLATEEGRVMGTPIYMAPEQARGKPIDRRVDVWAFGCVLYECLTARRAFDGETVPDVLTAVVHEEASLVRLPSGTPAHVRELLERCFEKDARQRLRDIGEARIALERGAAGSVDRTISGPVRRPLGWVPGALVGAVVGSLIMFLANRSEPVVPSRPITLRGLTFSGSDSMPTASPDERLIAFSSERDGRLRIWLKQLDTGGEQVLSEGPDRFPRFAPDGNSVLFLRAEGGRQHVYRQDLLGSAARKIVDDVISACWSPDGKEVGIVRVVRESEELLLSVLSVDVRTGEEQELYRAKAGDTLYALSWSPDGSVLAAGTGMQSGQSVDQSALILIPSQGGEVERLGIPGPVVHGLDWVPGGGRRVVYSQSWQAAGGVSGSLSSVILWDLDTGERRELLHAEHMWANMGAALLSRFGSGLTVVKDETLAFNSTQARQLLWEQEITDGRAVAPGRNLLAGEARDRQPVYSHDGARIRFSSNRTGNLDLWELDLESSRLSQLTDDRAQDWDPAFAANGEGLLWSSDRGGEFEIWSATSDGSRARQLSEDGLDAENPSVAPDGEWIVYWSANPEKLGIWRMRLDGSSREHLRAGNYLNSEVSDDGRWAGFLVREPHMLRSVVRVVEVETGRMLPFQIIVPNLSNGGDFISLGRMRWVSKGALSQGPAIAFVGVDDAGRSGVFLQDFDPENDTSATRRPLAGFHDDLITESFDIAPDGSRITLSFVEITRKLMLAEGVKGMRK